MEVVRKYRIGSRTSPLALEQVKEVLAALAPIYPEFQAELVGIETFGDQDRATPLTAVENSDFFTREIDDALLAGKIDFAVHSAKDLPQSLRPGLTMAALTKPLLADDALVARHNMTLDTLPQAARIGTSSRRREEGILRYRHDLRIINIRGNINERLALLDNGHVDGLVVAAIALVRLGLEMRIAQMIPASVIAPHPLQGFLAVVVRESSKELKRMLAVL